MNADELTGKIKALRDELNPLLEAERRLYHLIDSIEALTVLVEHCEGPKLKDPRISLEWHLSPPRTADISVATISYDLGIDQRVMLAGAKAMILELGRMRVVFEADTP